jgi:hypothetical protein
MPAAIRSPNVNIVMIDLRIHVLGSVAAAVPVHCRRQRPDVVAMVAQVHGSGCIGYASGS